jgi:hypothetical protein
LVALAFPAPSSGWTGLLMTSLPPNQLVFSGSTFYLNVELYPFSVQGGSSQPHGHPCHPLPSGSKLVPVDRPCSHSLHKKTAFPPPLLFGNWKLSTTAPVLSAAPPCGRLKLGQFGETPNTSKKHAACLLSEYQCKKWQCQDKTTCPQSAPLALPGSVPVPSPSHLSPPPPRSSLRFPDTS